MQPYRKLKVWEKAHELALAVYRDTKSFPRDELYGLMSQMRRAAVSIASNIAEGCGRGSNAEQRQFFHMAMGSAIELDYQLLLARDLGYLPDSAYAARSGTADEIQKMLTALIARTRTAPPFLNGRSQRRTQDSELKTQNSGLSARG